MQLQPYLKPFVLRQVQQPTPTPCASAAFSAASISNEGNLGANMPIAEMPEINSGNLSDCISGLVAV